MAKKKTAVRSAAGGQPNPVEVITVKIVLQASEETPLFYVNYAEVNFGPNEFCISGTRVPSRGDRSAIANNELKVNASVQMIFSPGLMPGIIRALTQTKDQYEAQFGPIKEPGVST